MRTGFARSLTLKWLVFAVLLATAPLAIAGISIMHIYQEDLKKSVITVEKEKANMVVERTRSFAEEITSNLRSLSIDERFREGSSPGQIKSLLENFLHRNDYLCELTLLDEKGKETIKVSRYKEFKPSDLQDQSKTELFRVASSLRTYYGDLNLIRGVVPTIVIAVPIEEYRRRPTDVLSAEINLTNLWGLISQTRVGEKGTAYVVDGKGNMIAHPDPKVVTSRISVRHLPMVDRVAAGEEGNLEFEDSGGEKYLVVYKPIKELGWGVIVQVPVKEAYAPLRQVAHTALKWILIALGVAIVLCLFFTRRLILPIKRLSKEMGEVAKGNLNTHIEPSTKDEIGVLTASFNQMIQDLKQSQEALKKAEEKYRRIFEDSKDMVYMTAADGKFVYVNQAGVDLFGYGSKEEMVQVYVRDTFLNGEDRNRFRNEIRKEWFVKDFEVKLKRKDGVSVDVLITANAIRDDSGKMISYEGIIKDISRRKRMEEELVQRTLELEALNEMGALMNQTLIDQDTVFPVALEKAMSLTGFEMGAIYLLSEDGDTLEMKYHDGHPSAMVEEGKTLKYGEGVSGKAISLKKPVTASINEYSSFREAPALIAEGIQTLVGFPLLAKGKALGTITLLSRSPRELSSREINLLENIGNQIGLALENAKLFSNVDKAKSEWETTFNAVTDLITVRDQDFRILRANKAAFKRFGLKAEEMIGRRCFETLHDRERPCEGCYVSETLRKKSPVSGERESRYLNGIFRYFTFPVYNETGEVTAVVDLAREITEERQKEIEKEVVNNINKILASSLDVRQVIKAVHSELKRVIHSARMTITLFDGEGEGFRYLALEKDYEAGEPVARVFYPRKGTPFEKVIETGLPIIVPDTGRSDSWIDQKVVKEGILSVLIFPLEYQGRIIGTMNFGSNESNHFSDHHIRFLYSIAPGIAISIQNALLFEQTRKRLSELTILHEMTKISTSSSSMDHMLIEIVNNLKNIFQFEILCIFLIDGNRKRLLPHPSYKGHSGDSDKVELCSERGITGWVAEKGEPLLVNNVREDSRYVCGDESICSEICVPLKVGQKVIGVIDAQSKALNAFSEDDLRLLNIAAGQIATIVENVRLQDGIKQSEEKYRTVVEGALDGVCVIGGDHRLKYANEKMAEIPGYSREELIGRDFRNYLTQESKALLVDREEQRKKGMKLSPHFEITIVRQDGDVRNVEISARSIKDSKGDVNIIVILKDITEKKKMEGQLLQNEKLRALGEMASGVAHDFNNALAVILGNTQLLLYTLKDEELRKTLQIVEKVAKDAAQTVRRLQDFTRKKAYHELLKLDINSIVQDAIEITKPKWKDEAQGKGIHIEMLSRFDGIPYVEGNASELREVITNMIFNSIEAMPEGGQIDIRTFWKKERVCIQISDTGIGMAEEVRKKAFEPFFTTKPFSNTGLGLSMSYGIIKRFGGDIEVRSMIGHGTTFTISLPAVEKEEEMAIPFMMQQGREARILVIDDEPSVRGVLSKILSQANHEVKVVENGEEGIRLFKEKGFDIVLTDLGMPGLSGWEVCREIKKFSPQTPVGMITGWGTEVDRTKMKETGLDFFISKPFDFNQILKVVSETMEFKDKQFLS